jgi:hypothetical protein
MTPKVLASGAVVVVLLVARAASAQTAAPDSPAWLSDRKYTEGIGVRTGDFELHPGIAGEVGYDSNYLLRSDRQGVANGPPIVPALEFRVTPSLYLSTIGGRRREEESGAADSPSVAFRAGINATWRAFVGLSSDSGASDITQQNSPFPSGAADAYLTILPGRPVGGALFADYGRVIRPNTTTTDPNLSFNRDDLSVGGELALQPGSGTLDWHFGYRYRTALFEEQTGQTFNNGTHQLYTRGRWRFRPRTALLYDATLGFSSYSNATQAAGQGLVSSTPVRARIGLNGLITDRFALLALVGWAASLDDTSLVAQQPQYDSVIGQAELTWFLAASPGIAAMNTASLSLSSIGLGYTRDFATSYLGNYYGSDRGYLRFSYFFAGRALVNLEGGVGAVEYPNMYWTPPTMPLLRHTAFTDYRADATLFAEYRFSDTFGLNTTLRYTANFSNTHDVQPVPNAVAPNLFDMSWNRFEAFLGARWFL